jgi:hypothetical protein
MRIILNRFVGIFVFVFMTSLYCSCLSAQEKQVIAEFERIRPSKAVKLSDKKLREIARVLMDFTEESSDERAAAVAVFFLRTIEDRYKNVFLLVEQFSCLNNDPAIAALLGFKPRSSVLCERSADDRHFLDRIGKKFAWAFWLLVLKKNGNENLSAEVSKIIGVEGFFNFDREIDKLCGPDRTNFLNRWTFTSMIEDFEIKNSWLPTGVTSGLNYGYDRINSQLFRDDIGLNKNRVEIPAMTESVFGTMPMRWVVYESGEHSAQKKIEGYKILLRLARLKFNALRKI